MAIINAVAVENTVTTESDINNQAQFRVEQVTVVTAGTPVQGPNVSVPFTVAVAVQSHVDNGNNSKLYIANSSANALDATKRLTLSKGQSVSLFITNANLIWFDSDTNGTKAVIMVEA